MVLLGAGLVMAAGTITVPGAAAPVAGTQAARAVAPAVALTVKPRSPGVVAGNTLWPARALAWKVRLLRVPRADRVVAQVYRSGGWHLVTTVRPTRTATTATGSFYPSFGTARYRVAVTTPTGRLAAASAQFVGIGLRTVSLRRVFTAAPTEPDRMVKIGTTTLPMQWHATGPAEPFAGIAAGRCTAVKVAAKINYAGLPGEGGLVTIQGQWSTSTGPNPGHLIGMWQSGQPSAISTVPYVGPFSISMVVQAWMPHGGPNPPWRSGEAWAGGVGLCSSVVR